ncbi:MAG: DUF2520 domain-containing protein [Bacteroidales bacterium]|nr:DUF2520 domain-containing protein [Bacteroidales bacterium]
MPSYVIRNVVFIGAGRLATHLAVALTKRNVAVIQVYNWTPERGKKLAKRIGAEYISDLAKITPKADLYVFAVTDSVLPELTQKIRLKDKLVVHTSGSLDMKILESVSSRQGVFYPLQTFTGKKAIPFRNIPICIEAATTSDVDLLDRMARLLTDQVYVINSEKRKWLHMTAVFAGNFSNFMYTIAANLLREKKLPFDLVKPLIKQVALNAQHDDLFSLQTGPAVREDSNVLDQHRILLSVYPRYLEIYQLISNNIIHYKKEHGKL